METMRRRLKDKGTDSTLDTFAQMQFHEEKLRDELTTDAAMVITDDGVKQIDFGKLYNEKLGDVEQAHKSLAQDFKVVLRNHAINSIK